MPAPRREPAIKIRAKSGGQRAGCKKPYKKGFAIVWSPTDRVAFHPACVPETLRVKSVKRKATAAAPTRSRSPAADARIEAAKRRRLTGQGIGFVSTSAGAPGVRRPADADLHRRIAEIEREHEERRTGKSMFAPYDPVTDR